MTSAKTNAAQDDSGVSFPQGTSGSQLFARYLEETIAAFPEVFGELHVPRGTEFRRGYAELVTQFEALRASSPKRAAIALFLTRKQLEGFELVGPKGREPLLEPFARAQEPLRLTRGERAPEETQSPLEVPYRARVHAARELPALADDLVARHGATWAAAAALKWVSARAGDGATSLAGKPFAVLGASAEIAPTEQLLRAGARVCWIDVKDPPAQLQYKNLLWVPGGADLLTQPAAIARTLAQFAGDAPLHLVACAYAPGRGREWRLAVAMNAIAHQLPAGLLASFSLLISPTTPAVLEPEDLDAVRSRAARATLWQRALARAGFLRAPHVRVGDTSVARSIVPIQGPTYQAAQHAAKRIAAEAFSLYGAALDSEKPAPLLVSANVAPITKTRSLRHPLFEAAFIGAPRFGVEIFEPRTTRALGFLLLLHDLQNPESPSAKSREPARAADLFRQQLHGGVFGLPWALEPSISASAVLGLGERPSLLLKLLR